MRGLFIALAVSLLWIQGAGAQANESRPTQASAPGETPSPAAQTTELAEADRLNRQVFQLHKEGKDDEALELASRVLEIRERALGSEHKLVAVTLYNLGELYVAKHKYGTAEPLFKRALSILEKSPGTEGAAISNILNALAFLRYMDRDFEKSEDYYRRVLEIREQSSSAQSLEVARALYNLAELYRLLSKYEKAEPLYVRLIGIEEKLLKPDDPELEKSEEHYICLLYESGKTKEAIEWQKQRSERRTGTRDPAKPEEVLNGKALSLPKPEYPQKARSVRAAGTVRVKIEIDETGKVTKAESTCGHPYLRDAAEAAAFKARFTPTLLGGKPVKVTGLITYNFLPPQRTSGLR